MMFDDFFLFILDECAWSPMRYFCKIPLDSWWTSFRLPAIVSRSKPGALGVLSRACRNSESHDEKFFECILLAMLDLLVWSLKVLFC